MIISLIRYEVTVELPGGELKTAWLARSFDRSGNADADSHRLMREVSRTVKGLKRAHGAVCMIQVFMWEPVSGSSVHLGYEAWIAPGFEPPMSILAALPRGAPQR